MNRFMTRLDEINGWFLKIGFISLFAMVAIDTLNVISLKLWTFMIVPGGKELMEELMVVTVYCAVAFVAIRQENIKTEILVQHLPARIRFGLQIIGHLVVVLISFLLLWRSLALLQSTIVDRTVKQGLISISLFPSRFLMVVAFLLLFISVITVLVKAISDKVTAAKPKALG